MSSSSNATNDALAQQYQRKTDKQHVLDNPDTYIGSIEKVDCDLWVMANDGLAIDGGDDDNDESYRI